MGVVGVAGCGCGGCCRVWVLWMLQGVGVVGVARCGCGGCCRVWV